MLNLGSNLRGAICDWTGGIFEIFWFSFLRSADARDKELLAQHNITHILSIHDTAAPVLEVSCLSESYFDPVWPSKPHGRHKPTHEVHNFPWTHHCSASPSASLLLSTRSESVFNVERCTAFIQLVSIRAEIIQYLHHGLICWFIFQFSDLLFSLRNFPVMTSHIKEADCA